MNQQDIESGMQQAVEAYQRLDYQASAKICNRLLIEFGPRDDVLNMKAAAQMNLGNAEGAEASIGRAVRINPGNAGLQANAARINSHLGRHQTALKYALEACRLAPGDPLILAQMAAVCRSAGDDENASRYADQCLQAQPENPDALFLRGRMSMETGDREAAEAAFARLVEIQPDNALALSMLAATRQSTLADTNTVQSLEKILAGDESNPGRPIALFTLSEICRREKQFERAFELARDANERVSSEKPFNIAYYQSKAEQIRAFAGEALSGIEASDNLGSRLVFIIGMPRTGTTLVEQMTSAHPDVFACGELPSMEMLESGLETNRLNPYAIAGISAPSEEQLTNARSSYLASLPPDSENFRRVIDKAPGNYQRAGFIHRLFPGARFLYCRRHPLDVILSCYFQNFQHGNHYTFKLEHLAQVYVVHDRIMKDWLRLMPESIHPVNYADLVIHPKSQARKIARFLGIDFHPSMLEPHKNRRAVKTASALQVRLPIYKSSLENWKNYRSQLESVSEYLVEAGVLDPSLQVA